MKSGFGARKDISATIFKDEKGGSSVSVRMVAFYLGYIGRGEEVVEATLPEHDLVEMLESKDKLFASQRGGVTLLSQRVAMIYEDLVIFPRYEGQELVPAVFFVKPDQLRYWSLSVALKDADSVAADIVSAEVGIGEPVEYLM